MTIAEITKTYSSQLDLIDIEILLSHVLKKPKEFVLAHPEKTITKIQETNIKKLLAQRAKGEPIAYILGHKEFYGLDFVINKNTLVPRPETELIVEQTLELLRSKLRNKLRNSAIIDVGTGSGNIIVSIAKECHPELVSGSQEIPNPRLPDGQEVRNDNAKINYFAIDVSADALAVAKKNAKIHGVDKKITFLHGDLLVPILKAESPARNATHSTAGGYKLKADQIIITANLPYLSKKIYNTAPIDVKKFEPKSALYSAKQGLAHYEKLLKQIKTLPVACSMLHAVCLFEISPEQKLPLAKIVKSVFPKANISFFKDLAGKWRICKIQTH